MNNFVEKIFLKKILCYSSFKNNIQLNLYAVGRGRDGCHRPDHDQQHCYHHTSTVKPETATAVVEFLMMGVRTPETC
jgi:hypothetical protein